VGSPELRAACAEALGGIGGNAASDALTAGLSGEEDHSAMAMLAEAVSKTAGTEDADAPVELLEAIQELFPRLIAARNAALKRQYAIAIGNTLGRPGEFYRFITGEASSRQARCRTLFASFRLHVEPLLEESASGTAPVGDPRAALDECGRAIEAERGRNALAACLRIHGMIIARLFGDLAGTSDFPEAAGRVDMRLGAWSWLAREAAGEADIEDSTCLIVALIGLYYLGSGI
jgi:hypothetical protein